MVTTRPTSVTAKAKSSERRQPRVTAPNPAPVFDQSWEDWLALNLKRGVPREKLLSRMVARGFDRDFCLQRIDDRVKGTVKGNGSSAGLVVAGRQGISFERAPHFVEVSLFLAGDEIAALLSAAETMSLRPGGIDTGIEDRSIRDCAINWIDFAANYPRIAERLTKQIAEINRLNYLFNITEPLTMMQLSRYEAASHYDFHQDVGRGPAKMRKLTCVLQLSADYQGGDLELFFATKPQAMSREAGTLIVFPSYTLHRVTTVKSGTRLSLVCWSLGPPFC